MTAGRIIGETFSALAALGPAGSVLGEVLNTWDAGTPDDDGLIDLGLWLSYACATAETSARTGAATARIGFAANAARGYSEDGTTWGLLVEPATTNRQGEQDLSAWNAVGSPVLLKVADPAGGTDAWNVEDDSAVAIEYTRDIDELGVLPGVHTLSIWLADVTSARADVYGYETAGIGATAQVTVNGPTVGWSHYTDSYSGPAATTACETFFIPANDGVADTGAASLWGVQVEDRAYPTSFIGADNSTFIRAAGSLSALAAETTDSGYFDFELVFLPLFASTETAVDAVLVYIDADNMAIFRQSDRHVVLILDGVDVVESAALTFAAGDELTIRLQHRPDRAAVTVTGASAGDGEVVGLPEPPATIPTSIGICSGPAGATEGLALHTVTAYQPIDGPIRLPGWMRLDDGLPVGVDGLTIDVSARVAIAAAAVAPDGLLRVTMVWRPDHDDSASDTLLDLGDATLTYDHVAGVIKWTVDDGIVAVQTLATGAVTFAAGDTIDLEIEHNDNRRRITVDGVAVTADPLPALILPSEGYVLSDSDGSLYGGVLVTFRPHLQTFAELVDERCLVQMGDVFRAWAPAMVQDKARTFDALLGIRAAFDEAQAVGTQLDTIGSIVGLPREGFTDERYKVFLDIQIDLLLSAAREDDEWVGTGENILGIARTFIGPSAAPIVLRLGPPYCYCLTIEGLVYSEAALLVRFLSIATHAGVRGMITVALADDSLWASDSVVVPGGGIWGSASVVVPDSMIWGTVLCTC